MKTTLKRIDKLKIAFAKYRLKNQYIGENYFNYSKFHVLVYYDSIIREFNIVDCWDSKYFETTYKYLIKAY